MLKGAGETDVEVPRSLAAQIEKHAQVNAALALKEASHQAPRAKAAAALKAAVVEVVGSIPPGVLASDSNVSEDPMIAAISGRVWYWLSCIWNDVPPLHVSQVMLATNQIT